MTVRLLNVRLLNITPPVLRLLTVRPLKIRSYFVRFLVVKPLAVTPLSIINVIVILPSALCSTRLRLLIVSVLGFFSKKAADNIFVVYKTSFDFTYLRLVIINDNTQI